MRCWHGMKNLLIVHWDVQAMHSHTYTELMQLQKEVKHECR